MIQVIDSIPWVRCASGNVYLVVPILPGGNHFCRKWLVVPMNSKVNTPLLLDKHGMNKHNNHYNHYCASAQAKLTRETNDIESCWENTTFISWQWRMIVTDIQIMLFIISYSLIVPKSSKRAQPRNDSESKRANFSGHLNSCHSNSVHFHSQAKLTLNRSNKFGFKSSI